jgi:flagellar assembly protein FliH
MPVRFPFGLRLDDGASPIVGTSQARPRPVRPKVTIRFNYPPLETFAPEPPRPPAVAPEPPPPPAPTFSEAELARAVEAARQEGYAEVRAEMLTSLGHRQAEALAAIGERLAASREALERMLAARAGASRDLAFAVARALVAKALARQPLADIEAMFREVVVRLEGMPWLELRLPPALAQPGEAALARAAEEADYRGELRVVSDPRLGPGDARLTWQDGAAERDLARLEAHIAALVEAWLPDAGAPIGCSSAAPAAGAETEPPEPPRPERPAAVWPVPPAADFDEPPTDGFE